MFRSKLGARSGARLAARLGTGLGALAASLAVMAFAPVLHAAAGDPVTTLSGKVNVNTATVEQLELLPGVGDVRARAILSLRKQRGGFQSLDQLVEVKGIGDALLERLRPHLTLSGKTTARLK
ncbi:MAG: helix-hairpin-helix domain-containing protein [Myxococcota bacterium]